MLENDLIRYTFDENGRLQSATDKQTGREYLAAGEAGNVLTLYEDRPNAWDAWDIDIEYENQPLETQVAAEPPTVTTGPVRSTLRVTATIGRSTVHQTVCLRPGSRRLDFQTRVEWDQRHQMLRVAFPTSVANGRATYDIQYGHIERPNHRNTSWDFARFEVLAHHFADLSTEDFGVALLNDCKYGHKVLDNVLDLNLLRSSTNPDPDADQGEHVFTYSLLPHNGRMVDADVQVEGARLNMPPVVLDGDVTANLEAPCTVSGEGVWLEALKRAEKDECRVIRLVESKGRESTCTLHTRDDIAEAIECDLLEWHDGETFDCRKPVELTFQPFEIRTFKLK